MSKDGPPISSGYRYGGVEALRTGLPTSATALRSKPREDELAARRTLETFAAYPERAKSIGKPLPATVGVSKRRAAALQRIEELEQEGRADRTVTLKQEGDLKTKWVYAGAHKNRLIEEDSAGISRISITYSDKYRATVVLFSDRVRWINRYR